MTRTIVKLDRNSRTIGIPPQEVMTIAADTAIDWKAITPATDVAVYFTGGSETTFILTAGITILVHGKLRLSTETVCLVF